MDELPEWTTEMDEDILTAMLSGLTLTPAVIADNIGRSREAVSRRLNTLEAGGLVEKKGRGKYTLVSGVGFAVMQPVEVSEEEKRRAMEEDIAEQRMYHYKFGISREEFRDRVLDEYHRLEEERDYRGDWVDLYVEAERNVIDRIKEGK